jgi:hypothetical protein
MSSHETAFSKIEEQIRAKKNAFSKEVRNSRLISEDRELSLKTESEHNSGTPEAKGPDTFV